eukprot:scaffold122305_cov35-Tisochrysis_lutea.AAC.1
MELAVAPKTGAITNNVAPNTARRHRPSHLNPWAVGWESARGQLSWQVITAAPTVKIPWQVYFSTEAWGVRQKISKQPLKRFTFSLARSGRQTTALQPDSDSCHRHRFICSSGHHVYVTTMKVRVSDWPPPRFLTVGNSPSIIRLHRCARRQASQNYLAGRARARTSSGALRVAARQVSVSPGGQGPNSGSDRQGGQRSCTHIMTHRHTWP